MFKILLLVSLNLLNVLSELTANTIKRSPKSCEDMICIATTACINGICVDVGSIAYDGVCGGPSDKICLEEDQKCHVETEGNNGTCVSDIPNPGETCGHLTCGKDLQCETIYPPPCWGVFCKMTNSYRCIKKKAPRTCETVTCPAKSKCVNGTCIADSTVANDKVCGGPDNKTCEEEQKCHVQTEGNNGTCVSDTPNPGETCGHLTCGKDLECKYTAPLPCWGCKQPDTYRCIKKTSPKSCEDMICIATTACINGICVDVDSIAYDGVCGGPFDKICLEEDQKCHVETEGDNGTCVSDIPNPGETCGHLTCGKDLRCSSWPTRTPFCKSKRCNIQRYRCTKKSDMESF